MKEQIKVEAIIKASLTDVWAKWTKPEEIMNWCFASPDWHAPAATNDLKVGGKFSTTMAAKDGSFGFDFGGEYTSVIENQELKYTLEDDRKVSIFFSQKEEGVEVVELFDPESENPQELQQQGWQAILNNFKAYCEQ